MTVEKPILAMFVGGPGSGTFTRLLAKELKAIAEPISSENVVEISGELPFEEQYETFNKYIGDLA